MLREAKAKIVHKTHHKEDGFSASDCWRLPQHYQPPQDHQLRDCQPSGFNRCHNAAISTQEVLWIYCLTKKQPNPKSSLCVRFCPFSRGVPSWGPLTHRMEMAFGNCLEIKDVITCLHVNTLHLKWHYLDGAISSTENSLNSINEERCRLWVNLIQSYLLSPRHSAFTPCFCTSRALSSPAGATPLRLFNPSVKGT